MTAYVPKLIMSLRKEIQLLFILKIKYLFDIEYDIKLLISIPTKNYLDQYVLYLKNTADQFILRKK